jgi:heme a synthase
VTGVIPPRTYDAWNQEFEKYKSTPEYQILNPRISLDDFKSIYYMEYTHRILGRIIGLSFVLPAAYFIIRGKVSRRFAWALGGIGTLIGFQGFLGWWMVKSGLKADELRVQDGVPRVSQYRLAAHLGTAFGVFSIMVLMGLSVLKTNKFLRMDPLGRTKLIESLSNPDVKRFRGKVIGLSHMVFVTALSGMSLYESSDVGALVAGLDAGLIYNEFPMMGESLIPPAKELFNPYYTRSTNPSILSLVSHNIGENPVLAQLDHRILAVTTFTLVTLAWASAVRRPFPKHIKSGMHTVMGFAVLQVAMGISTLIYMVPTHLAATHQAGSLALLTAVLVLLGRLRAPTLARIIK